ncbi:TonB-dependent receptor [Olivibacter sp. SDN3]|uniref:TonB-dependent receptor n=1 Tax=Olivibacter sp. SDN3 TaxID=2764720 RepID=UPI001651A56B|nr:carboxypeptidase regulatory-like domain-containing protein [Olivibacter sp. SDN3]QNL48637.1 TonB-dependent receptor [Olivibacter sp. SDN3]
MKKFLLSFLMLLGTVLVHAQVTTSSMSGTVLQSDGEPSIGASVRATHVPSGTIYGGSTNENGRFNLANMRVGGPYSVEITYIGSQPAKYDNIILQLGQPYVLNVTLSDGLTLDEVVISATGSKLNTNKTGAGTNVNTDQINTLPAINRSIEDLTRLTPQSNGFSMAGRDGRYNNFQVDGSNFNNGFGLSDTPIPGAQPISLDAIEELQVNIAPYDVRESGFTGGGINAVTRSGTNIFTGSVYGFYNNENFNGRKIFGNRLGEQDQAMQRTLGARFGGPIIKNKLFFFVNYEEVINEGGSVGGVNLWRPSQDGVADPANNITRVRESDLIAVRDHLINQWGYDPGAYQGYANEARSTNRKILARIDWNINEKHRLAFRYNQSISEAPSLVNGNSGPNPRSPFNRVSQQSMAFEKSNYSTENSVRSFALELNSTFSSKLSNQFLATYSRIQDVRNSPSEEFPFIDIGDGTGQSTGSNTSYTNYITAGYELFTKNNDLLNQNFGFINNLTYLAGDHTITGGLAFDVQKFGNNYVRLGTSYYRYATVADFLATGGPNEVAPINFGITYPYEGMDPYARTNYGLASAYIQDKFNPNEKLELTVGLRAELPLYLNNLTPNPSIDALELLDTDGNTAHYSTGSWPKSRIMLSPRVGFRYDVFGDRTLLLRGGTGIFTGRVPFVWLSNMPTNSGVLQNTIELPYGDITNWIGNVRFNPDPYHWVNNPPAGGENVFIRTPDDGIPSNFALVDPDFRMPSVWRTSIGGDYQIPGTALIATADIMYTHDINAVMQFAPNRLPATNNLQIPDENENREFWPGGSGLTYNDAIGANSGVILTNAKKRGYSFSSTVGLSIAARKGLYGGLYYTYTDAKAVSDNPGSNAGSAFVGLNSINSPNDQILHPSQYGIPHRIMANLSYRFEYANHLATTVSVYYDGSHQGRFSYIYSGDVNGDGIPGDLLYIPNNVNNLNFEPIVVRNDAGEIISMASEADQRAALEAYISGDPYLSTRRGQYAERSGALLPWLNRFDVRVLQDIFTDIGGRRHSLQVSLDIQNFGNLLNSGWGIMQRNTGAQSLMSIASVSENGDPTYQLNKVNNAFPVSATENLSTVATTWSMLLGLRYIF